MVRIVIPEPTSPRFVPESAAYNQRALPQYLHALISAGATPIPIPLHESPQRVARILATCHGILLPGSPADIDPQTYGQTNQGSEPSDPDRAAIDQLLLEHAFLHQVPILAICQGLQALNTRFHGTLIQDIPTQIGTQVDHAPGRAVQDAHAIQIAANTRLAAIFNTCRPKRGRVPHVSPLRRESDTPQSGDSLEHVNSSHHQCVHTPGDNLQISAISPLDQVVEALELRSETHFVLAVQWHPERSYDQSPFSRAIFQALLHAAQLHPAQKIEEPVLHA